METVRTAAAGCAEAPVDAASTRPSLDGDGEAPSSARPSISSGSFNEADSRWRR